MHEEAGTIYILTNVAMPNMVKIGCTTGDVLDRIKDLTAATGVPLAFECHFAAQVENFRAKERTLHQLFGDQRVNPKREFFSVAPEKVVLAISMGAFTEITPGKPLLEADEETALEKASETDRKKRSAINLTSIGILPGTQLTFSRDESLCATVVAGNRVEYEGQIMSLSGAALMSLHKLGYKTTAASGSDYWMLGGDTLDEIRIKKETQITAAAGDIT